MYGWRGRIGLIVPSSNTTLEPEMRALCPHGVEVYATRIAFTPDEPGLRGMRGEVRRAAQELTSEGISDLILFGCTVGSMIGGKGYDEALCAEIAEETGTPAVATTTAVIAAIRSLGVSRIAVATPYTRRINEIEASALRSYGVEVVTIASCHEDVPDDRFRNRMIGELAEEQVYELGRSVDREEAEAIFLSCTNLRTLGILRCLEHDLGKPVLSSNLCNGWLAAQRLRATWRAEEIRNKGYDITLLRSLVV